MAALFQIRRGESGSLDNGELYYNTISQSLQIGNNTNTGVITFAKLNEVNSGSFNVSGHVTIGGTITIGDNTSDNLVVNADLSSSIIPNNDNSFDLGSTSFRYRNLYTNNILASTITGSISGTIDNINITEFSSSVATLFSASNAARVALSASIELTDNTQTTNITTNSASAWGAFQSASSYSSSFSSSLSIVSKSVYDLSSSLAGNTTLSSSIYETDATQSNNIATLISKTGSYATTGSNIFTDNQTINASISASGNISASNLWINGTITTYELHTIYQSASVIFSSGSQAFGDNQNDKVSITGSLEVSGSTNFIELSGSLAVYSTSVDSRLVANSASAWGAFQSASAYSASLAASITSSNIDISIISASAWGAFQSASSYSGSFYTTINNATQSILINSQSTWGAFQSASSYSSSFYTTINNATQSILINSQSAWGAFQSASSYSSSFYTTINNTTQSVSTLSSSIGLLQTFSSSQYKSDSSSFDSRIDNLILGAGAQVSADNEFTGQNSFSKYITGSISGAVDGIDVRALSASLNTRIETVLPTGTISSSAQVNIYELENYANYSDAVAGDILVVSASAWGAYTSASVYSASLAASITSSNTNITTISASTWGAFQSASSYSASLATSISASKAEYTLFSASNAITDNTQTTNITEASASAWGAFQSASSYSSSFASRLESEEFKSTTFATTGSNIFTADQTITGSLYVTGDVVAYSTSDERLKDNIQLISNPIQKVQQLRGVEFDWNDKSMFKAGKHDYGVIAQDVEKVLPELVKETNTGYLGVDYDKIIGLLIEVVKEQEKRIKDLENKLGS